MTIVKFAHNNELLANIVLNCTGKLQYTLI